MLKNQCFQFILLVGCLFLISISVSGQSLFASQTQRYKGIDAFELIKINEKQTVLYTENKRKINLLGFNENLEKTWQKDVDFFESRVQPLGAIAKNEELSLFYTFKKKGERFIKLMRYSSFGTLIDTMTIVKLEGEFNTKKYNLFTNESKNHVVFAQKGYTGLAVITIELSTGKMLYSTILESGKSFFPDLSEYPLIVDDQGQVFFFGERNNRKSRLNEHACSLYAIRPNGDFEEVEIPLTSELNFDLLLTRDKLNKKLVLTGYSTQKLSVAQGYIYISIDEDFKNEPTVVFTPFSESFIKAIEKKKRLPDGVSDLKTIKAFFLKNGNLLLIGEQQKVVSKNLSNRPMNSISVQKEYSYLDFTVSMIDVNGQVVWNEALPKSQVSVDDSAIYSSAFFMLTPSCLRIIYNDLVKRGGTISEYIIQGAGSIKRHSIANTEQQKLLFIQKGAIQLSGNECIIPSIIGVRVNLAKLKF